MRPQRGGPDAIRRLVGRPGRARPDLCELVRIRSMTGGSAVQVRVRAIASGSSAEVDTPAAAGDVGNDHNGAPLRRERTGAGVRGRSPRPSADQAAAREAGGSTGRAASPRQTSVSNTV